MLNIKPSLLLVTALFGVAFSAQNTVMDMIQNSPELSLFNKVLNFPANERLSDLLSNPNANFTILAPTNDASIQFHQFLAASNITLTEVQISNMLYYHIIPDQSIMSKDLSDGFQQYPTLYNLVTMTSRAKGPITPATYEAPQDLTNGVIIYGKGTNFVIFRGVGIPAHFTKNDLQASNGVIHVIDRVLVPPLSLWRTLEWRGLTKVMDSIKLANVLDTFQLFTNVTFLVPSNAAVAQYISAHPELTPDALRNVLLTHVIPGYYFSQDLKTRPNFKVVTKSGEMVQFAINPDKGITIGDAVVTNPDILTNGGVLHVIDKVLTPGSGIKTPDRESTMIINPHLEADQPM